MKHVYQFLIICLYCFLGDLFHSLLPFPIPGSIYGMLLLLFSLITGIIKPNYIQEISSFLSSIMPIFFVMPCVSILTLDSSTLKSLPGILFITIISTLVTMGITGKTAQFILNRHNHRLQSKGGQFHE